MICFWEVFCACCLISLFEYACFVQVMSCSFLAYFFLCVCASAFRISINFFFYVYSKGGKGGNMRPCQSPSYGGRHSSFQQILLNDCAGVGVVFSFQSVSCNLSLQPHHYCDSPLFTSSHLLLRPYVDNNVNGSCKSSFASFLFSKLLSPTPHRKNLFAAPAI
jgi:hypothetical protein